MKTRGALLFSFILMLPGLVSTQNVQVVRYIPGDFLSDNQHVVELSNSGATPANLSGYLLVTRDYSVKIPSGTVIAAKGTLRIVRRRQGNLPVGVELSKVPDFFVRIRDRRIEGNYVALLDKSQKPVTGFYYSPLRNVPYLPDTGSLYTANRERIPFRVPEESNPIWGFLSATDDPAIAFVFENGKWQYGSARSTPATVDYRNLSLRYHDGVVTLKWTTAQEQQGLKHRIERSEDQENFTVIDEVEGGGSNTEIRQYTAYDAAVKQGKIYYYRIRSNDAPGRESTSKIAEVKTEEGPVEFSLEVLRPSESGGTVGVRFFSQYSQKVKIKLLDASMTEVAILFNDYVFAGTGNLLRISGSLPPGRYTLIADTETKRFFEVVEVTR